MRQVHDIFIEDGDQFACCYTLSTNEPRLEIRRGEGRLEGVNMWLTPGRLDRMVDVLLAFKAAHPELWRAAEPRASRRVPEIRSYGYLACPHCGSTNFRGEGGRDRCIGCNALLSPLDEVLASPRAAEAATASEESLEVLQLEEIREALTDAAQACGIDPDGLDDVSVIRAIVARARRAVKAPMLAMVDEAELLETLAANPVCDEG